ncbi:MAG: 2-phosphosulfolactate phosphatase [Anaerolineales bacterium]
MKFHRTTLESCQDATGMLIVIDVLRAFSTAAYAFFHGAEDIRLVSTVDEAFMLKKKYPGSLLMGEVDGLPIQGFDFGNSPPQFDELNLSGEHLIQRTTSGTQGVVRSSKAENLLAASFCNAKKTSEYIQESSPSEITFVITGLRSGGWGDEDAACADYIESLIRGDDPDPSAYLTRVEKSLPGQLFQDPNNDDYPLKDLEYCLEVNRFDFIMPINRVDGDLLMIARDL